ncbi:hypothetical protein BH23BAC4_BH23BAC4_05200 [soil metagenome]
MMRQFLFDQLFPRALSGLPVLGTPENFAVQFGGDKPLEVRARALVRRHIALCSSAGFLSGLGGWLLLPVVMPANIAAVALLQLHMTASVAALSGEDPSDPKVKEAILGCLVGHRYPDDDSATDETLDRVGIKLAERGFQFVVATASGAVDWAGRSALKGFAKRRLARSIPMVGGFIGAISDGVISRGVANAAIRRFATGGPDSFDAARQRTEGSLPLPSPSSQSPAGPDVELIPHETHEAELRASIDDLERGLEALPLPKAINRIHSWKRRLQDSENPDFVEIAEGLDELAAMLTGADLDGGLIGETLQRLGRQTTAVSTDAPAGLSTVVARLGDLLTHAGGALVANARNAPPKPETEEIE